ncbi:hypothetical protein SDC9_210858 [bioreactor metagenome]|uniref:Uncharacterized protein n=1 Tax=bioreactor metagenome TaxID=1076179 RepID=A0A645JSQ9_9ZZZZ
MKYNEKAVMLVLEPCDTDGYFVQCLDCGACGPVGYPEEYDHYDSDAVQKAEEEAKAKALDLWANIKPRALMWTHEPPKVGGFFLAESSLDDCSKKITPIEVFPSDHWRHSDWEKRHGKLSCLLCLGGFGVCPVSLYSRFAGPIAPPID